MAVTITEQTAYPSPISTDRAAVYQGSPKFLKQLKKDFTFQTKFQELYSNYIELEDGSLLLPRNACPLGAEDGRVEGLPIKLKSHFKPRDDDQDRVAKEMAMRLKDGENFITQCQTGWGKTVVSTHVISVVARKTLVVVTKEDIRDQWVEVIQMIYKLPKEKIGIVQAAKFKIKDCPIVIAMIQSVSNLEKYSPDQFDDFGLVIWDECHRVGAEEFSKSAFLFRAKLRLGLSATPSRQDGKDNVIFDHIGKVKVLSKQETLIPKIITKRSPFKLPMVSRKIKGVWKQVKLPHKAGKTGHITKMMANDFMRNKMIVDFVVAAFNKDRNIIIFTDTLVHLERLNKMLLKVGVPNSDMAFYVGGLKGPEREKAKKKRILLATYSYASEATDIPKLDTLVFGTPRSNVEQIVGRIRRLFAGKKDPVVFDLLDFDSLVFRGYFEKRLKWYRSIGAKVVNY